MFSESGSTGNDSNDALYAALSEYVSKEALDRLRNVADPYRCIRQADDAAARPRYGSAGKEESIRRIKKELASEAEQYCGNRRVRLEASLASQIKSVVVNKQLLFHVS